MIRLVTDRMDNKLEAVRVACWDLRAQWESALRTLSEVQKSMDRWDSAGSDGERERLLADVQRGIEALTGTNTGVRQVLFDVRARLDRVFARAHNLDKS